MSAQIQSLRRFLTQGPSREEGLNADRVVVLAGGKGGVGTSTVAAFLAVGLARRGERVLLVDGSQGWLHMLFGFSDARGLAAVRSGQATPAELVVQVREGLDLLPAGLGDEALMLDAGPMERRSLARKLGGLYPLYDAVLIDAGSRLASVLEACELGAERVITVTSSERLAVASAYALVKGVRSHFPDLRRQLLINRESPERAAPVARCIDDAVTRFGIGPLEHLGTIPLDARLVVGIEGVRPVQHTPPDAPAARATLELAALIQDELKARRVESGEARLVSKG